MENSTAFEKFAPSVLEVYNNDKEELWKAVMSPYLSDSTV